MCGGNKDKKDEDQFDESTLPEGWEESIKKNDYKGDDYVVNKSFKKKNLVDQKRKCRDGLCCILFTAFLAMMFCFALYGYHEGQPGELVRPVDGNGRICGSTQKQYAAVKDYPKLWIADFTSASLNPTEFFKYGVCVKECPKDKVKKIECVSTKDVRNCARTKLLYKTEDLVTYCFPDMKAMSDDDKIVWTKMLNTFRDSAFGNWAADIYRARMVIASAIGICILITIIYVMLMQCFAVCIAWVSVALIQISLIALGFVCFFKRN